jgi:hypothetical protein
MVSKKCWLAFCLLAFIFSFSKGEAVAENGYCSNVEISNAGAGATEKILWLKNTRTDCGNWTKGSTFSFYLDNTSGNASAMLATALSSQAKGTRIIIVPKVANTYNQGSTLIGVYTQND